MKNISHDAMPILAEVCMEINNGDVLQSYEDVKLIDDLVGIIRAKSLINHTKGRKSNREKRFTEIFKARIFNAAQNRINNQH